MENLTPDELKDIESEKTWRQIARMEAIFDSEDEDTMQFLGNEDAVSGFFEVKESIVFCNELRMDMHDAARRAYAAELVAAGYTPQQAWNETDRISQVK